MTVPSLTFTSLVLYPCLAASVGGFYLLPVRWRPFYLLVLSYAFYAGLNLTFLPLLIGTTGFVYFAGMKLAAAPGEIGKRLILWGSVALVVAVVIYFKIAQLSGGILLPLGLSYYSFKLISYLVEIYWDERRAEPNAIRFFLYPAFFAQIPSGPIQRPDDFLGQIPAKGSGAADFEKIVAGIKLILGGLMLKLLVGDRLGAFVDVIDMAPTQYGWPTLLLTTACYTLQLFADFAGYTNIAIGIAKLFGIDSPPNFAAPFAAANIQEFWRRWHMTLTFWVRDYLFLPLSMALRRFGTAALILCITVNMAVIGLWHGLTINFLIFGLCHAVFIIATVLTRDFRDRLFGAGRISGLIRLYGGIALTFAMMTFSQIFWHAPDLPAALTHFRLLFGLQPAGVLELPDMRSEISETVVICALISFYIGAGAPGLRKIKDILRWHYLPDWVTCGLALFLLSAFTPEVGSRFIYGQF